MSTEPRPSLSDLFPLPGIKLRTHRFGKRPYSDIVTVPVDGDQPANTPRPEFRIHWEDQEHGLTVLMRERGDGRLIADVSCADAGQLNKTFVSVALVGTATGRLIRKTIPLNVAEPPGCRGSADFGSLADAAKELGYQLGLIVFRLLVDGNNEEGKPAHGHGH